MLQDKEIKNSEELLKLNKQKEKLQNIVEKLEAEIKPKTEQLYFV